MMAILSISLVYSLSLPLSIFVTFPLSSRTLCSMYVLYRTKEFQGSGNEVHLQTYAQLDRPHYGTIHSTSQPL
jgi:hypothetical protein